MESPEFAAGVRSHGANGGSGSPNKRKRSTMDSSPASADHDHNEPEHDAEQGERPDGSPETKSRRLPGVKRACNECRQQKVGSGLSFVVCVVPN